MKADVYEIDDRNAQNLFRLKKLDRVNTLGADIFTFEAKLAFT